MMSLVTMFGLESEDDTDSEEGQREEREGVGQEEIEHEEKEPGQSMANKK